MKNTQRSIPSEEYPSEKYPTKHTLVEKYRWVVYRLAVTEQDLFFKQPLLNPSFDESNLNEQPAVNSGASGESAAATDAAQAEPPLLDEMALSKEYITAEIDMLVSQGRGCTDTQKGTEDVVQLALKVLCTREHEGLKFPDGEVIIEISDIYSIMNDMWSDQKSRTMSSKGHSVDEMMDFLFDSENSSGSGSRNNFGKNSRLFLRLFFVFINNPKIT